MHAARRRSLRRSCMVCVLLVAASLAAGRLVAGEAGAAAAPDPSTVTLALTGDFVEMGPALSGASRSLAMIDFVNASGLELNVVFGEGTATLKPQDHLLVHAQPGDTPLRVTAPAKPDQLIDGALQVERGLRYQVVFDYGPVPTEDLEDGGTTQPLSDRVGGAQAPSPGSTAPPSTTSKEPPTKAATKAAKIDSKRKRNGHVDVGRRRPGK